MMYSSIQLDESSFHHSDSLSLVIGLFFTTVTILLSGMGRCKDLSMLFFNAFVPM